MSYPHANSAYFHSSGLHHQQPQQQPQSHSLPQHFQRGGGGYTQQQLQQQASYDGQAYNNGAAMNYHHTTGGSANSLAPYQQQQGASQGFSVFGGDAHSQQQQQQQQQQHSHHVGNGAAGYNAGHSSPYMPQSNAYPSSGAHSSSIDEHYQHPHHQQQQQFSSYDSGHSVEYSHGPHASHHHHHSSLGARMGSPGLGSSRDSNSSSLPGGMRPKRRQVKNACINCQKACKKCDEGRPCSRCIKYGLTDSCVDSLRKERKRGIKRGPYKRRATTSSSNAAGSSSAGSSSTSGNLMSTSLDSGHHGYHAGHSSEYSGGGGIYRTSTLPSSSSSAYNNHNGGSLFQRDQPRSAIGPDVKPSHNSSAWQQQQQQATDVKGSWTGLSHSSSSASSTDAQSSRLPMLNVQSHGGYTALDNGGSTSGRVALSPAPMYGSQSASSTSPSVGQPFRLLPSTANGPSNFSMSTQSGVPPHFHQRYPSDSGATSLYSSSGATPAGSSTSGSSANFSSPRTPLTAELTTNGAVGLPSVSDLTSPPIHGSGAGLYLKSPGLTGPGQQGSNLSASYILSQPQQGTGAPQRQFALQMPPMPRGRGGGMVDMFNGVSGPFRGGAHYKVDPDEAAATNGALTTTA